MTQLELYQTSLPVSESILGKLEGTRCATARTAGSTAVYCSYCWQYSSILSYCWQYSSILPVLLLLLLLLTSCRFRKGHSCETQLTTIINDWAKILDNRGQVDTFILDFEKAFDTPPHELLKSKLFSYGIGGKTLKWIDSFLCFRQQRVVVNGVKSDWAPVLSGVPQGTVLGPLLFSLYINDISSDIESEIRLFADDCVCYREIKDEKDTMKVQRDIDRLGSWARKWGMRFQPVKCNMMQLTRKRIKKINASYTLEGTNLENVESIKYLGVTITSDLRWNTHVSNVCTKANRTLGFLRRNLYSCPQEVKEAAYKAPSPRLWQFGLGPPRFGSPGRIRKRAKARCKICDR